MLVVKTKEIFLLNLHQNRVHFPAERNAFVLDHQHGRRDVTCKPAMVTSRGRWQWGLDPGFYDCTRKEIRPSETKYSLVENKMADVPSKVVVENFSRSSSVKSASVTLYLLWIYFEENRRRLGWNQNG